MNIYVGNLSYSVTEEDLNAMFSEFGDVTSAKLIMDRDTGRSKGFAFVEMSGEDAGQKAIDELNGRDVGGRSLTVNKARPREERPPWRRWRWPRWLRRRRWWWWWWRWRLRRWWKPLLSNKTVAHKKKRATATSSGRSVRHTRRRVEPRRMGALVLFAGNNRHGC